MICVSGPADGSSMAMEGAVVRRGLRSEIPDPLTPWFNVGWAIGFYCSPSF